MVKNLKKSIFTFLPPVLTLIALKVIILPSWAIKGEELEEYSPSLLLNLKQPLSTFKGTNQATEEEVSSNYFFHFPPNVLSQNTSLPPSKKTLSQTNVYQKLRPRYNLNLKTGLNITRKDRNPMSYDDWNFISYHLKDIDENKLNDGAISKKRKIEKRADKKMKKIASPHIYQMGPSSSKGKAEVNKMNISFIINR